MLSLRYPALIALAFLLGKWAQRARLTSVGEQPVVAWSVGWMPSFAIAFGVATGVVALCAWWRVTWARAARTAAAAVVGLCLRELWQLGNPRRTFDPWDVLALGVGCAAARRGVALSAVGEDAP